MNKIPDRFLWATQVMEILPKDRVLEIGCGVGLGVEAIASKLETGKLVAIDQSRSMVDKAVKRNAAFVESRVASIHKSELIGFKSDLKFDKILCFNINFFWTKKDIKKEMDVIQNLMSKKSQLYIFYGPMLKGAVRKTIDPIETNLKKERFTLSGTFYEKSVNCYCLIAEK